MIEDVLVPRLDQIPFLKDSPARALKAAERETSWFSLPGGWSLFQENDPSDMLYFVMSGSLGAFRRSPDGRMEFLGHIRAGEPVGEMSLLSGEPHANAVYALRDCELLGISRAGFRKLIRSDPEILERLTSLILLRLRRTARKSPRADPRVFGLFATSPTIDLRLRAEALRRVLVSFGLRVCIVGEESDGKATRFFDELEREHDIVLLTAAIGDTPWFKLCLRQSDRVWILARADARPSTPLMPEDSSPARKFRLVDVILLHHEGERRVSDPGEWMDAAEGSRLLHWRGVDGADCQRLARMIAGRSVGLVLSGGGARAYAHVGVVQALREAGCPIDFIGGSSMGAVVAACVAQGWSNEEIDRRLRKAFVETNPLSDFVLPVVAMTRGRKVDARLAEHFGDIRIEDLSLPFFAVTTNLSSAAYKVHTSGRLRDVLRASIALPGILPPVVMGSDVHVDGAVLNNFPVDVMRDWHRGLVIGCDVAREQGFTADAFINPPEFASWVSKHGFSSPPPIAGLLMRAATISVNPNAGRDKVDVLLVPDLGEVDLRDWKAYDVCVEAGYEATAEAIVAARGAFAQALGGGTTTRRPVEVA